MNINEFGEKVRCAMKDILGEDFTVCVQEYRKNNNVVLHGLSAKRECDKVVPTIYLDSYHLRYEQGENFGNIMEEIRRTHENGTVLDEVDMHFFSDFEKVKDRICVKLISVSRNRDMLQEVPFMPFLDLAIVFYYDYEEQWLGRGSIQINNAHMQMWHTDVCELMKLGIENTARLYPASSTSIFDLLEEMRDNAQGESVCGVCEDSTYEADNSQVCMYVATNSVKLFGASTILYEDFLKEQGEAFQKDFYILPSSIHEVILLAKDENMDENYLRSMIHTINDTQVDPMEVLSDTLYYYDRRMGRVTLA